MTCEDAAPLIGRAAEPGRERSPSLARHLAVCPDCRRELETQMTVRQMLQERPVTPVAPGFVAGVMTRLDAAGDRPGWRGRWRSGWLDALNWQAWTCRLAPVAAGLLVAAGIGLERLPSERTVAVDFVELASVWMQPPPQPTGTGAAVRATVDPVTLLWDGEPSEDVWLDLLLTPRSQTGPAETY